MKYYAKISSERGKVIAKGGNDKMSIVVNIDDRDRPALRLELLRNDDTTSIALFDLSKKNKSYIPVWCGEKK